MAANDANATIHAAALAAAAPLLHAGDKGCERSACGTLQIAKEGERIVSAHFRPTGDPLGDAYLELYCREIERLPAEEAAAHAAAYVVHRLAHGACRNAAGISSAVHLHPVLGIAEQALRDLRRQWRAGDATPPIERAEFLALPAAWLEMTPAERLAALREALAGALCSGELPDRGLAVDRLENDIRARPVRITVSYPQSADPGRLPAALRELEAFLRERVAPWLEVYAEERQDRNKLRRTILVDQRNPER